MSGEDDTFDLDIYGDESQAQEQAQQQQQQQLEEENPEDRIDFGDDTFPGDEQPQQPVHDHEEHITSAQTGQKRKAPDDGHDEHQQPSPSNGTPSARPASANPAVTTAEPNATQALKLSELHWWTTEEDLRGFCAQAAVESSLRDIAFGEHKINGKSRGEAYLEFDSPAAASAVKRAIEAKEEPAAAAAAKEDGSAAPAEGKRKNQFQVWYVGLGNPFKGRDSGQATKKDAGAYNAAPQRGGFQRGGFQDRGGRGGFQARGGGGFQGGRGGGYQQQQHQAQQGFGGMNGGYGGYGSGNPMMGGMMANPMMAMGMNGMGFRGGFGGMGGMMGAGGAGMGRGGFGGGRGGYGMGGRGGAGFPGGGGGGYQGNQGFMGQQGGGYGFGQQQQQQGMQAGANKRPRQE